MEDLEFEREFENMMNDSIESHRKETSSKTFVDVGIPMNLLGSQGSFFFFFFFFF